MNRFTVLFLLITIRIISCKNSEKEFEKLEIAKKYYEVLDKSNVSGIETFLTDSLLTKETEYDYEQIFSKKEYVEWLKWDSVFEPICKILEIGQANGIVKVKISKTDKRISFLHKEPIVTEQVIRFDKGKTTSIETTKYLIFKDSVFVKNREELLNWIHKNHLELNGFIHDQTKTGLMKSRTTHSRTVVGNYYSKTVTFLKFINLYSKKES